MTFLDLWKSTVPTENCTIRTEDYNRSRISKYDAVAFEILKPINFKMFYIQSCFSRILKPINFKMFYIQSCFSRFLKSINFKMFYIQSCFSRILKPINFKMFYIQSCFSRILKLINFRIFMSRAVSLECQLKVPKCVHIPLLGQI